jgi:hypothetical protein
MSFREKSAWITLLLLLAFGVYFVEIAKPLLGFAAPASYFPLFLLLVAAMVIVEIALHVCIAVRSPQDARAPRDERERAITQRATARAYFWLLAGAFAAIGSIHLGASTVMLAHCVLFAIWIAELARHASLLYYYRHGV